MSAVLPFPSSPLPGLANGYTKMGHDYERARPAIVRRAGASAWVTLSVLLEHSVGYHRDTTDALSTSDLMEATGLTRPTVLTALSGLKALGIVQPVEGKTALTVRTYQLLPASAWTLDGETSREEREEERSSEEAPRETSSQTQTGKNILPVVGEEAPLEVASAPSGQKSLPDAGQKSLPDEAASGQKSLPVPSSKEGEKITGKKARARVREVASEESPREEPAKEVARGPQEPDPWELLLGRLHALPDWRRDDTLEALGLEELLPVTVGGVGAPYPLPFLLECVVDFAAWRSRKEARDRAKFADMGAFLKFMRGERTREGYTAWTQRQSRSRAQARRASSLAALPATLGASRARAQVLSHQQEIEAVAREALSPAASARKSKSKPTQTLSPEALQALKTRALGEARATTRHA